MLAIAITWADVITLEDEKMETIKQTPEKTMGVVKYVD
jgi:hypothetical protein